MGNQSSNVNYKNNFQINLSKPSTWEKIKHFFNQNDLLQDQSNLKNAKAPLVSENLGKKIRQQNNSKFFYTLSFSQKIWQRLRATPIYQLIEGWDQKSSKNYAQISQIIEQEESLRMMFEQSQNTKKNYKLGDLAQKNITKSLIIGDKNYQEEILASIILRSTSQKLKKSQIMINPLGLSNLKQSKFQLSCSICISQFIQGDKGILQCGHFFHIKCIQQLLRIQIGDGKIKIVCPIEQCRKQMTLTDIHNFSTSQLLQKYYRFTFNAYIESQKATTIWCPTPGCQVVIQFEDNIDKFNCNICKQIYCLKCRQLFHQNLTCLQYKIQLQRQKLYSDEDFIRDQCPNCKYWVQKKQGCNIVTCRCTTKFCYVCRGTGCKHHQCINSGQNIIQKLINRFK